MEFATCDLCDANEDKLGDGSLAILPPVFSAFGNRLRFAGPVRTLKVFEDNVLVRAALETPGEGAGPAQHAAVRIAGRHGHLPPRQAETRRQQGAHFGRCRARQHGGQPLGHLRL